MAASRTWLTPSKNWRPAAGPSSGPGSGRSRVGLDQLGQQPPGLGQPVPRAPVEGRAGGQDAPQALDERPVGDPGLLLVAAAPDHRGPQRPGVAGQLVGQPGLADAGLALDHHQPPVGRPPRRRRPAGPPTPGPARPAAPGGCGQPGRPLPGRATLPCWGPDTRRVGFRRAPGSRRRRQGGRRGGAAPGCPPPPRRWRGRQAVGLDGLVDGDRLLQRLDPQLLLQDPLAGLELAQGGPAAAAPGVDPHELAVGRLVQRVEGQPAAGGVDRVVPVVLADLGRGQPLQRPRELAPQPFGLEVLPVVEAGAVAQAEPGQEVAPVQPGRRGQRGHTGRAGVLGRVAVVAAAGQQRLEIGHVQPEAGPGEPDGGPVRGQPPRPDGLVQGRQGAPQRPPGVLGVVVGPEQPGHGVAAVPLGVHGQVGQQRDRLAGVDLDRRPVPLHPRRPQQRDPQLRHAPPFPLPPSAVSMARPGPARNVPGTVADPAVTDSVTMPERWDGTTAPKEVP